MPASLSWAITTSCLSVYIHLAYTVARSWTYLRSEALQSKLVMNTLMPTFGSPPRHMRWKITDTPFAWPYLRPFLFLSHCLTVSVSASAAEEVQTPAGCTAASLIAHLAIRLRKARSLLEH